MNKKVHCYRKYIYKPVPIDTTDPPLGVHEGNLAPGDIVQPVKLFGCPPPNTMGHCHIMKDGHFVGLVSTNSLEPIGHKVSKV
jgi:hypothetical protein